MCRERDKNILLLKCCFEAFFPLQIETTQTITTCLYPISYIEYR